MIRPEPPAYLADADPASGPATPVRPWSSRARAALDAALGLVPSALAAVPQADPRAGGWEVLDADWTSTGTAVVRLGPPGGQPVALLRISPSGAARLPHETRVLHELAAAKLPAPIAAALPRRLAAGTVSGSAYAVDALVPGVPADTLETDAEAWAAVSGTTVGLLTSLHQATATRIVCDDDQLHAWVDAPLDVLAQGAARWHLLAPTSRIAALRERLRAALRGVVVEAGWVHGDLWSGNLLVDPSTRAVTGVVDWDLAASPDLPLLDVLHLLLHHRRAVSGQETGQVVADVVRGRASWDAHERALLDRSRWCLPDGGPADEDLVLLAWLRHVAAISLQQRRYVAHSVRAWELRNVHRVLRIV